jgi:hypothetical protein
MNGQTSTPRRFILALATFIASVLAAISLGVAPAVGAIWDDEAEPSHVLIVTGDAGGPDSTFDAVIGHGVTYVVGAGTYTGAGLDATLTRISHTTWTAATTHYDSVSHGDDFAAAVALGRDGAIYTAGSSTNGGKADMLVIKWSRSGCIVWSRRYNGPAKGDDFAADIAVDGDGNVVVCGPSKGANGTDWAVVSWTSKGVRRWLWRWDGSGKADDAAADLLLDAKGRVYICGFVTVGGPKTAAAVVKLGADGATLWKRTYTGPLGIGAWVNAVAADPRGGVLAAGYAEAGTTGRDGMIVRYSPSGARIVFPLLSQSSDAGPDTFVDLAVTTTRRVVAVGSSSAPGSPADPLTAEYTLDGASPTWLMSVSTEDDRWVAVAADALGGYVATGAVGDNGTTMYTRRFTTVSGGMGWLSRWAGPVQPAYDQGTVVATRAGMVVAAGTVYSGAATGWDQAVLVWLY